MHQGVGPGFKNDPDHPDGAGYPVQIQPRGQLTGQGNMAQRVRQADERIDAGKHVAELPFIEFQPFQQRTSQVFLLCLSHIQSVLGKYIRRVFFQLSLNAAQRFISCFYI